MTAAPTRLSSRESILTAKRGELGSGIVASKKANRESSQQVVDRYVIVCLAVYDGGIVAIHQLIKLEQHGAFDMMT